MRTQELVEILKSTNGKVFRATFVKRTTGEIRNLVGRLGVHKGIKGVGLKYNPLEKQLLLVYDFQKREYRMINLEGLIEIKFQGQVYRVDE